MQVGVKSVPAVSAIESEGESSDGMKGEFIGFG